MQSMALEMNLSETAYVVPRDGGDGFDLRWFTPAREVDLCGHATLATAHVLWETERLGSDSPARFHTRSGILTAERGADGWIEMDFPGTPAEEDAEATERHAVAEALGVASKDLSTVRKSLHYWLAELASETEVRSLEPRFEQFESLPTLGVIATAPADATQGVDFVSRFFAPRAGVPEDPVTGSAHCVLAPWWAERLGRNVLVGYQASRRGGTVRVRVVGERVRLGGQAVTVWMGRCSIPSQL